MRIGVVGINHKHADLKLREILARICQKRFGAGQSTHGKHIFVLLSTCNRMELYFSSLDLAETHSYILHILNKEIYENFDQKLYSYFGIDCFHHLVLVATGFDSAIIAETEIQGQVKNAYEAALGNSELPSSLHYLFQKTLKISKDIRAKYSLGRGMPDIEHAILQTGTHLFKQPESKNILFVGASEINQKVIQFLKRKGCGKMTLCNRSQERAHVFSQAFALNLLPWEELHKWHEYDWIIFGTKSSDHIINSQNLREYFHTPKLIIDLSLPRNVCPEVAKDSRIQLLNIDQINRMLKFRHRWLNTSLLEARNEIQHAVERYTLKFQERKKPSHIYTQTA